MARWSEIEEDAPQFAARVRQQFDAGTNKTIATLRSDGSPRISATELKFERGTITFGMMGGSLKLRDVRRDPRVAVHSPTLEPPKDDPMGWLGDAKLAGTVIETSEHDPFPDPDAAFFALDISEVVLTYLGTPADHLVIESWHPGRGWERRTRA